MSYLEGIRSRNPVSDYELDHDAVLLTDDGKVPLIHWPVAPNFGDLLSPWLIQKMTGHETQQNRGDIPSYIVIGSVLKRVRKETIVWGSGSFGTEQKKNISSEAKYCAVRGPLTRALVRNVKGACPRVYGDPALLAPCYYDVEKPKTYKTGFVIRWSEPKWRCARRSCRSIAMAI